ncbi:mmpL10 [Acrasis kona]|uniref:MmpL10 n=1 Tax=Acrasis kona TaxID=1008807 RepID=A0AAW2ZDC3_9EUKA
MNTASQQKISSLIQEAEKCFVSRKFRLASARALLALSLLTADNESQEQFFSQKLIPHLQSLRRCIDERQTPPSDHMLKQINDCLAIIIQCYYELNHYEDAYNVLPSFYGSFESSPFELQVVLVQMLVYLNKFEEARVHLDMMHKQENVNLSIVQELEDHLLLKKRTEGQQTAANNKFFLNNMTVRGNASLNGKESNQDPKKTTLLLPGQHISRTFVSRFLNRWRAMFIRMRRQPLPYLKTFSLILTAFAICTFLLRKLYMNRSSINQLRIKSIESMFGAIKMTKYIL